MTTYLLFRSVSKYCDVHVCVSVCLSVCQLITEWGWRRDGVYYRDQMKQNKMSDKLFLDRMMSVAEQE